MPRTKKEYAVYAAFLQRSIDAKPLFPIHEDRGHKLGLRRHSLHKQIFDEVLIDTAHCGEDAEFTLGAVKKVLTPGATALVKYCDWLIVRLDDDIPLVTYNMEGGAYFEVPQFIDRDSRPKEVWVMFVDEKGKPVPNTRWDKTELPDYVRPKRKEMAR
jgi:hypothetical protein